MHPKFARGDDGVAPPDSSQDGPDARWRAALAECPEFLPSHDAHFAMADQIREGNALERAELEARILADQPVADIDEAMDIPGEAVQQYEQWFFDVRDRRADAEWLARYVPGCRLDEPLGPRDVGALWRRLGWQGTFDLLEVVLANSDRKKLRKTGIKGYLTLGSRLEFQTQVLIAQLCLPFLTTKEVDSRLRELVRDPNWRVRLTDEERKSPIFRQYVQLVHTKCRRPEWLTA